MFGVRVEDAKLPDRIVQAGARLGRPEAALRDFGGYKVREIKLSFERKPKGEPSEEGEAPARHTGGFSRATFFELRARGEGLAVGSSHVAAEILHKGGVVKAVKAENLAIPIHSKSYGKRPRDFSVLVFGARFRRGGMLKVLLGIRSKRGKFTALFVLQKRARIRPHPWVGITPANEEYLGKAIERQADRELGVG